jgi:uncharacterized repeat protein (TIGR01451 family)
MTQDSRVARTRAKLLGLSRTIVLLRRGTVVSHIWRKALAFLVLATLVGLVRPTTVAQPQSLSVTLWSDPEVVGEIGGSPAIDMDEKGNAYVVWADGNDVSLRTRSADSTWQPIEPVVTHSDGSRYSFRTAAGDASPAAPTWVNHLPDVAADGLGRAHVVWVNNTPHPDHDTFVQYRLRGVSGSWGPVEEVAHGAAETRARLVADSSGGAYVAWQDGVSLESKLRVRSGSGSWGEVESIGSGVPADMTVDAAGNLYVVINSADAVYFRHRSAAGEWGTLEIVNDQASSYAGAIDVDSAGNAYVATAHSFSDGIYLNYRPVSGTWQGNELVAQGHGPSFALDAVGNGYYVWLDDRDGDHIIDSDIYGAYRWQDSLWGADSRLVSSYTGVGSLDLATRSSGDLFYLVWAEPDAGARRDIQFMVGSKPADYPDLSASQKTAAPSGVRLGEVVQYVFEVQNVGKTTAFMLTDSLHISTTLVPDSGWYDTGVLTASTRGITWTAVSTSGTAVRAGFSVTVSEDLETGTLRIPILLPNVAGLSFGTDQFMELAAIVIVDPIQLYLPLVVRGE